MKDTVIVASVRLVPLARAEATEAALRDFQAFAERQPGCEGILYFRRAHNEQVEFTALGRFTSVAAREAIKAHPDYPGWLRRLDAGATHPAELLELHGLEAWFGDTFDKTAKASESNAPPVWKMAAVTYLGVNIVTTPLLLFLPRWLSPLPFPWSNFAFNLVVVATLTWVAMPLLTGWTRRWLTPPRLR